LVVTYGVWYSSSVFLVALLNEFGWSRSLLAGAFSAFILVKGILGPPTGWLAHRLGPKRLIVAGGAIMAVGLVLAAETTAWWHFYLAFGGVAAVGMSLVGWVTAVILIQEWFPRRFGTALGIASTGIGVGMLVMVPAAQLLIEGCGWRWAYRILGLLTAGWVVPAGLYLIQSPSSRKTESPGGEQRESGGTAPHWTLADAARSWPFWGVAAAYFTGNVATQMLLLHQVVYLVDAGVPALTAAAVAGTVGLVSIGSKAGWGVFSDWAGREWAATLSFACVAASLGALVLAGRYPDTVLPYLYATLLGIGYGVVSSVFPAIAADLFGGPGFSTIYGTLYIPLGIGLALGTWGPGQIFDWTGTYAVALWIGLALALITPALIWVVAPRRPKPPPGIPATPC
jgi:MFS family permease